ncbi:MAG: MFS transporter [Myxococcales bacterium FL481]|nr:MAG: MFS transporter [Myxococcales bacterium FL481]
MSDSESSARSSSLLASFRALTSGSTGYLVVNAINITEGIAYFGILALLTLFLQHGAGWSLQDSGSLVGWFTALVTLLMVPGGVVVDRLGVRRGFTVALGLMVLGRAVLLIPGVTGPGAAALWGTGSALFVMAAANGVLQPALYAGVKEYTDPKTASMGYAVLYAAMNLGMAGELLIAGNVREWWAQSVESTDPSVQTNGLLGPLLLCMLITMATFVLHTTVFTRKVEARDRTAQEPVDDEYARKSFLEKAKSLPITDARFLYFIFILLFVRMLFAHQWLTVPHYATYELDVDVNKFLAINPIVIVIFTPLITAYTQRVHVLTMMIVGTTISAVSTVLLWGPPSEGLLIAYMVLFSLGEAVWSSRFLEYVADMAPVGQVGAYMGLGCIPWFAAKMLTGQYSGHMLAKYIPEANPNPVDPETQGVLFRAIHEFVALLPAGDASTMWTIYGVVACISPLGLIAARKWIVKGVSSGIAE